MKVWIFTFLLLLLSSKANGQAPIAVGAPSGGPFNYMFIEGDARIMLEAAWDDTKNPDQAERAYCIRPQDVQIDTTFDHASVNWHITSILPADSVTDATPYSVSFHCPEGSIGDLHIHVPTTCVRVPGDALGRHVKSCVFGGKDAYMCQNDEWDQLHIRRDKEILGIVQCDKHSFVVYWAGGRRG